MVVQKATLLLFTLRFKMINLKVSEAYAFDYLAILQIKCEMDPSTNFKAYSNSRFGLPVRPESFPESVRPKTSIIYETVENSAAWSFLCRAM